MPPKVSTYAVMRSGFLSGTRLPLIKDQLDISTWLLFGATLQCCLVFFPIYLQCLPALSLLAYKTFNVAIAALKGPVSTIMPGRLKASFEEDPQGDAMCVFHIGFRSNQFVELFAILGLSLMLC
jgi:hypothetical protein